MPHCFTQEEPAREASSVGQACLHLDYVKSLVFLYVPHTDKSLYIPVLE